MWANKYIGIPFKARGRDYSGVDCWGLVRLVYSQEYDINLPSFENEYMVEDTERIRELMAQYKEGWQQLEEPCEGCVVLLKILGQPTHVGIMVNSTEFLHSRQGYDVAMASLTSTRWSNRVIGFFKYAENTGQALAQAPHALSTQPLVFTQSIPLKIALDLLHAKKGVDLTNIAVFVGGNQVPENLWSSLVLQDGDVVTYREILGMDDGSGAGLFKLAIIIGVSLYAPHLAVSMGLPGATVATAGAAVAWGAAITIASTYLLNAIFPVIPPNQPGDPGSTEAQLMVEGGGNRATPYSAIPVVLGKIRLTPPLAAQNYITYPEERTSYLTTAVCWGFGPLVLTDFKIGEAVIDDYVIKDSATITGYNDNASVIAKFNELYARDINQPQWNPQELIAPGGPEGLRIGTTPDGLLPIYADPTGTPGEYYNPPGSSDTASEVAIAFHMPEGMRKLIVKGSQAGSSLQASVQIQTQYKLDNGAWQDWETFTITNNTKDAYTIVRTLTLSSLGISGERLIQVQARRLTGGDAEEDPNYRYMHKVVLLSVTYTSNRQPIIEPPGSTLARSVYVIQAKDQLNGQLEGINAVVQSRCRPVTNTANSDYTLITSNPAALFLHVLTHPANPQRIELADLNNRIDMAKLAYWYTYCDTQRQITYTDSNSGQTGITKYYKYEYNGVLAEQRSVLEVLREICAAGRASPGIIDGKWTVTIDEEKTAITQHFSPQNSWGFESVRMIPKEPDGLKVTFYDEEQNYQQAEIIVYNTGKNYSNSTLFESIQLPGVTNRGAVVDHAKWHFAQAKLRREVYSLNCDIEYLSCNRGDRVKVTHDVPAWGAGSGRIADIFLASNEITGTVVKLTERLPLDATKFYSLRVRGKTGSSTVFNCIANLLASNGFTRSSDNTITIQLNAATIPFESTDNISITCIDFPQINITNQKVTVNRQNNTISYKISVSAGTVGFNTAIVTLQLTGEYDYLFINGVSSITNKFGNTETLSQSIIPTTLLDIGDSFLFGELGKESQDLIVLSIEPQDNKTAKITFVDYGVTPTYNIFTQYQSESADALFNTNITLPPKNSINVFTGYIVPVITTIYSNDPAVETIAPGTFRYNIKVSYATVTKQIPVNTKYVECQYYLVNAAGAQDNIKSIYSEYASNTITIPDVIVGQEYAIRLRYITNDGVAGPWPVTPSTPIAGWNTHTVQGFTKYLETVNTISIIRIGKFFRFTINSTVPNNFKEFKIKIYKNQGSSTEDFWDVVDPTNIKVITTANRTVDFNILDFAIPRISEEGTKYRIACRPVDIAGNESESGSALTSITLTTINP